MTELLLELYSEEIPSRMQPDARKNLKELILKMFIEQDIFSQKEIDKNHTNFHIYSSPCRLIFHTDTLPETIEKKAKKIKGPKTDATRQALQGFLKSQKLTNLKELKIEITEKGKYYFYETKEETILISEILSKNLPKVLQDLGNSWPKSMRWGNEDISIKWIRPLQNILCILDEKIIDFEFFNLKTNNKTYGHKCLTTSKELEINSYSDYFTKTKENFVIFDQNQRQEIIQQGVEKACKDLDFQALEKDLNIEKNTSIINEAIGATEYPVVLYGKIDRRFMDLSEEIIINTIKNHQKYFCLRNSFNKLVPHFIFVANIKSVKETEIIKNNEKVVRARLSDAEFFANEDLRTPLIERQKLLKNIIFHDKIGTLYDKTIRLTDLAKFISVWIPHTNILLTERAAELAKTDLTTNMVSELPELQGLIGSFYANKQNEEKEVSDAIAEQYLPAGKNDSLPKTPIGITLAISDKMDTLTSLFLTGEKPTSSKDPFALRRATLGIIRIILEYKLHLPLNLIINKSLNTFISKFYTTNKIKGENVKKQKTRIRNELLLFITERFRIYLKDLGYKYDIVDSVISKELSSQIKFDTKKHTYDIFTIYTKIDEIDKFTKHQHCETVLNIYKRISNIIENYKKENKKTKISRIVYTQALKQDEEKKLYQTIKELNKITKQLNKEKKYIEILEEIYKIRNVVEKFFENVLINVEKKIHKNNRITLLQRLKNIFDQVADFSKIES